MFSYTKRLAILLVTYQNPSLGHGVLHLVSPDDLSFFEHFESVKLSSVPLFDEHDFAV